MKKRTNTIMRKRHTIITIIGILRKLFKHTVQKTLFLLTASHIRKRSFRNKFLKHQ